MVAYAGFFTVIQRSADGEAGIQTAEQITDGHTGTGGSLPGQPVMLMLPPIAWPMRS